METVMILLAMAAYVTNQLLFRQEETGHAAAMESIRRDFLSAGD